MNVLLFQEKLKKKMKQIATRFNLKIENDSIQLFGEESGENYNRGLTLRVPPEILRKFPKLKIEYGMPVPPELLRELKEPVVYGMEKLLPGEGIKFLKEECFDNYHISDFLEKNDKLFYINSNNGRSYIERKLIEN